MRPLRNVLVSQLCCSGVWARWFSLTRTLTLRNMFQIHLLYIGYLGGRWDLKMLCCQAAQAWWMPLLWGHIQWFPSDFLELPDAALAAFLDAGVPSLFSAGMGCCDCKHNLSKFALLWTYVGICGEYMWNLIQSWAFSNLFHSVHLSCSTVSTHIPYRTCIRYSIPAYYECYAPTLLMCKAKVDELGKRHQLTVRDVACEPPEVDRGVTGFGLEVDMKRKSIKKSPKSSLHAINAFTMCYSNA